MSGDLRLAATLARRGTGSRRLGMAVAAWIAVVVVTLVLALPDAYRKGDPGATADRLVLTIVAGFLLLPVVVLLLAVSRLSAATRDRRLGTLRMLGLSPRRTRLVAAAENGLLSLAGGAVGVVAVLLLCPVVSVPLVGAGAVQRPLAPSPVLAGAVGAVVVLLTSLVALAPTRRLASAAMTLRGPETRPPSWWRVSPLLVGGLGALVMLTVSAPAPGPDGEGRFYGFFLAAMACVVAAAGGVVLALPLVTRGLADLLSRSRRPTLRLAGRRMQVDPAASARVVSGLAISVFLLTSGTGVMAAFRNTPQYLAEKHSLEVGPQVLTMPRDVGDGLTDGSDGIGLPAGSVEAVRAIPEVRRVVPQYLVSIVTPVEEVSPGEVFVGSCGDLAAVYGSVDGCRDGHAAWVRGAAPEDAVRLPAHLAAPVHLESRSRPAAEGGPVATIRPAARAVTAHPSFATTGDPRRPVALFVPSQTRGLAALKADWGMAYVVTGPGYEVRDRLAATGLVRTDQLQTLETTDTWNVAVWALLAIALSVGLVAVLITAIDRANERRREVAAQVAIGVPARILRLGQAVQVAAPSGLAVLGAVLTGYLSTAAFLHAAAPQLSPAPLHTIGVVLCASGVSVVVVALATLTGISSRLTPDLLRQE